MIREAVVAGQFYPADKSSLLEMLKGFFEKRESISKIDVKAAVVPHAGYIYSGKVAAGLYSLLPDDIETAVILGPNHTGLGKDYSLMKTGAWQTPLGKVEIDEDVAEQISKDAEILKDDFTAHRMEHSIEVQVPFLQYINPRIKIVPIVLGGHNLDDLKLIANAIAISAQKERKMIVIASSDMTHYESAQAAEEKDKKVIDAIIALDDKKLIQNVKEYSISMCGAATCYVAVNFAKKMGLKSARLINYQTSAEVSGDYSSVVGYASIALM
ncbi:MAG: AmmeMemoRadiSam system protein B [Candidatus Omnitrophota bacterium]